MTLVRKLNSKYWLAFSYGILVSIGNWALGQPVNQLSVSVLLACMALGWIPAFWYVNRRRIARNEIFEIG